MLSDAQLTPHFFKDAHLPSLNDFDAIMIMGGPMSVHDEHDFPWLKKDLVPAASGCVLVRRGRGGGGG